MHCFCIGLLVVALLSHACFSDNGHGRKVTVQQSVECRITVHMLLYWWGSSFELVYRHTGVQGFVQPMSGCGTSLFPVSHVILVVFGIER